MQHFLDPEHHAHVFPTGIQSELILGASERQVKNANAESCSRTYLQERVEYSEDRLMDEESKAVMMAWETPLMEAHAKAVCARGGDILNVGFGMGLVDTAIQRYGPSSHTIIEAHPGVYARMVALGWGDKPNVKIILGRWQDVIPQLSQYDGIVLQPCSHNDLMYWSKRLWQFV